MDLVSWDIVSEMQDGRVGTGCGNALLQHHVVLCLTNSTHRERSKVDDEIAQGTLVDDYSRKRCDTRRAISRAYSACPTISCFFAGDDRCATWSTPVPCGISTRSPPRFSLQTRSSGLLRTWSKLRTRWGGIMTRHVCFFETAMLVGVMIYERRLYTTACD